MEALKLYAITDRTWLKEGETLADVVEKSIIGGVSMVQLREKNLPYNELKDLAISVKSVCKRHGVPFIVNDDVMLAKDINADGVHVGQSDAAVCEARRILGPDKIIGATAKTVEQAKKAETEGATYLGSGAIFGTTTKKDARPMTMELLTEICDSVNIPVVAIGGIDKSNAAKLKGQKIAGVAIVSGIYASDNVRLAASNLNDILYGRKVIQCITNHVTVNQVANVILALGGSPIMAHHPNEVSQVQDFASGLLINLGATDNYESMKIAYKVAIKKGHPIVIDPVGVGGIEFRREFLNELLEIGSPTCIRGNFGEIKAIYSGINTMSGLDYEEASDEQIVLGLAKKLGCIVVASGEVDLVADAEGVVLVETGSIMQKNVTGSGCMLSAAVLTMLTLAYNPGIQTVVFACKHMGDAAKIAETESKGPMSFFSNWMDSIYNL